MSEVKEKPLNQLAFFVGKPLTFPVPSGDTYTIREQNADDDETLTRLNVKSGKESDRITNINKFIQAIVTEKNGEKIALSEGDVLKMKLRDKYHILLKTRIHSIGPNLKFLTDCRNKSCKEGKNLKYNEDLTQYDNDFTKPEGNGFKYQIKPYKEKGQTHAEFLISSGKKFRIKYLDGYAELALIERANSTGMVSDNTGLYMRELEVYVAGAWQLVSALNFLSKGEGIELKQKMDEYDAQDILAIECECPHCQEEWIIPFNQLKDFFSPLEI